MKPSAPRLITDEELDERIARAVAAHFAAAEPTRPRNLRGWRTIRELKEELRFPSDEACRSWLRRHHIVSVRRGRVILVDGLDIDRVLRGRQ